ncbi:hypothetical protein GCM10009565_67590 [Amycolatopsis albidoflavus]
MAARKRKYPGATRKEWSAVIGISDKTLGKLERGEYVGPDTLADVEIDLGWAPGSCQAIMHGGEPTGTDNSTPAVAGLREVPLGDGVTFTITKEDRLRWRTMTPEQIIDEGNMIGRTIGLAARAAYLRAAGDAQHEDDVPRKD